MKTANIVILESSEDFLSELKNYFEGRQEFNICAVSGSGTAGIEYIDQYKPDVVILNLVLSGRDGFSVLDHIRNDCQGCRAIVVSNFSDEKIISSAISHGASYYFVKPVDPQSIAERVTDILSERPRDIKLPRTCVPNAERPPWTKR